MASASAHPRRRPARPSDSSSHTPSLIDSFQKMSLRKGDTYHPAISTEKKNEIWDPLDDSLSMPARSTTCPKALEDLLIGAGERRAAELLQRVDKAIETNSKLALGAVLSEPEVLPTFLVDGARPRLHRHRHSSDSGIGSSVADSDDAKTTDSDTITAIDAAIEERGLSKYASDQIHKHIVEPILQEQSLKEFHLLIEKVPERIGNKDIKTLRDLEKTLIFLAPDYALSPSKYLSFCERTIRVLHTTATTLHESDQRVPTDRPYTQGYFFDLVEQIRRYAQILAATREREEQTEKNDDEMDYTKGESVSLHGGMTHNGKAPELVRHTKDGKAISLATGQLVSTEELSASSMKRPMPADLDDEDALRSMARRKKGAKPEIHECHLCDKEFKRNCDLTKHIKTHERPWKCTEEKCKYFEYGWPTEKERDRHVNDKHSSAPPLYHCLFQDCPYTSKRESNCKQHMEKAHGWTYVRSKSNGKGRASGSASASSSNVTRLPRGSVPPSPAASLLTPLTPILPSPSYASSSRHDSMPPPGVAGPSNYGTPAFTHPSPDFAGHFNMNFNFNDMTTGWPTPAMSEERRTSTTASSHSGLQLDGSSFDDEMSPNGLSMQNFENYDFGGFSFNDMPAAKYMPDSGFGSAAPHTSPGAQLDQTFSTDAMNVDNDFGDFTTAPTEDFTLFGAAAPATTGDMMPSLPAEGSSWGNFGGQFELNASATNSQLFAGNSALDELFPELKEH